MKKVILLFMAITAMGKVFAQSNSGGHATTPIIYTLDTIIYQPAKYKLALNSKIANLLKATGDYEIYNDTSIIHYGQEVKRFTINGKYYSGLNMVKAIKKMPIDILDFVESAIDYKNAVSLGPKTPIIDETLNIHIKESKVVEMQQLLFASDILAIGENITKIRLDCRDYFAEALAQLPIIRDAPPEPDIDDYGDQIPHFIITPSPGSWISKATRY